MTDLDVRALDGILALSSLVTADLARFEQRHGLSTARVHLLWQLGAAGPATQRSLADALQVSARNVTGLVDGLVASGHVTRERHPTDRRAVVVTLSATGRRFVAELQESHRDLARQLFDEVRESQLAAFVAVLDETMARFARLMEEDR